MLAEGNVFQSPPWSSRCRVLLEQEWGIIQLEQHFPPRAKSDVLCHAYRASPLVPILSLKCPFDALHLIYVNFSSWNFTVLTEWANTDENAVPAQIKSPFLFLSNFHWCRVLYSNIGLTALILLQAASSCSVPTFLRSVNVGEQICDVILRSLQLPQGTRGSVVVKALCYKPEGHGFGTRWGDWFSSIYLFLPVALGPGVYSASNRNEYQKHKNNVSGE
jgi:hypothetical protein